MARKRGRGMAACWYGIARTAVIDRAAAWAELDDGGSAKVVTGVTEIGEGILTVLAQIAAHEMGVKPEHVVIGDNDTARAPEASHAGASRQTYMIGNAVALASREARGREISSWVAVWPIGVPGILRSRKLNYVNLADKTYWLLCAGNAELYVELRHAAGTFVDCKQGPLFIRSSERVHCDDTR